MILGKYRDHSSLQSKTTGDKDQASSSSMSSVLFETDSESNFGGPVFKIVTYLTILVTLGNPNAVLTRLSKFMLKVNLVSSPWLRPAELTDAGTMETVEVSTNRVSAIVTPLAKVVSIARS